MLATTISSYIKLANSGF